MIQLSPSAVNELKRLQRKQRQHELQLLRLEVHSSGCAGLSYGLSFVVEPQPGDQVFRTNGMDVVVSPACLPFLQGIVVDYSEDLMGGGFRFQNPNAQQTCGCGQSFAPAGTIAAPIGECTDLGQGI